MSYTIQSYKYHPRVLNDLSDLTVKHDNLKLTSTGIVYADSTCQNPLEQPISLELSVINDLRVLDSQEITVLDADGYEIYKGTPLLIEDSNVADDGDTSVIWDDVQNKPDFNSLYLGINANAASATKLVTARTINGTSFDGTANISFTTNSIAEGTTNKYYSDARVKTYGDTVYPQLSVQYTNPTWLAGVDASKIITGTIDLARLPALPSANTIVCTTISAMSVGDQALVAKGTVVIESTTGNTYRYSGTGSVVLNASYIQQSDLTPDWVVITNRPTNVSTWTNDVGYLTPASSLDPSKVTQSASYRFSTDAEKATWNAKQNALGNASATVSGILTSTDWTTFNAKQPAGNYSLAGHTHAATDITQTASYRFVTDTEKTTWGSKIDLASALTGYVVGTNVALAATDTVLGAFNKIQAQLNGKQAAGSYEPGITPGSTAGFYRGDKTWSNTIYSMFYSLGSTAGFQTYNGGGVAEWYMGQNGTTQHGWQLNRVLSGAHTTYLTMSTSGIATFANRPLFGAATPWDSSNLVGTRNEHDHIGVYQPLDSDLTAIAALATTSYGRGFLTQTDAAAACTYIGAATSNHNHSSLYQPLENQRLSTSNSPTFSGATFTSNVTFANGTWNVVGDDASIGDINEGATLGLKGNNASGSYLRFCNNGVANGVGAGTGVRIGFDGTQFKIEGNTFTAGTIRGVQRPDIDRGTTVFAPATGTRSAISNGTNSALINRWDYSGFMGYVGDNSSFFGITQDHENGSGTQLSIVAAGGGNLGHIGFFAGSSTLLSSGAGSGCYQAPLVGKWTFDTLNLYTKLIGTTATMGNAFIGTHSTHTNWATFGHSAIANSATGYNVLSQADGTLFLNAPSGKAIQFINNNNGAYIATVDSTGFKVGGSLVSSALIGNWNVAYDRVIKSRIGTETYNNDDTTTWSGRSSRGNHFGRMHGVSNSPDWYNYIHIQEAVGTVFGTIGYSSDGFWYVGKASSGSEIGSYYKLWHSGNLTNVGGRNYYAYNKVLGLEQTAISGFAWDKTINGFYYTSTATTNAQRIKNLGFSAGDMVVTVKLKASVASTLTVNLCDVNSVEYGTSNISVGTSYASYTFTFKNVTNYLSSPYFGFLDFENLTNGSTLYVSDIKIEKGFIPSDYSWAPEDVTLTTLNGLSTATNAALTPSDTIISAFGKLQAHLNAVDGNWVNYASTGHTHTLASITGTSLFEVKNYLGNTANDWVWFGYTGLHTSSSRYAGFMANKDGHTIISARYGCYGNLNAEDSNNITQSVADWNITRVKVFKNLEVAGTTTLSSALVGTTATMGNAFIGTHSTHTNWATFGHSAIANSATGYNVLSQADGTLNLNAPSGKSVYIRNANDINSVAVFNPTQVAIATTTFSVNANSQFIGGFTLRNSSMLIDNGTQTTNITCGASFKIEHNNVTQNYLTLGPISILSGASSINLVAGGDARLVATATTTNSLNKLLLSGGLCVRFRNWTVTTGAHYLDASTYDVFSINIPPDHNATFTISNGVYHGQIVAITLKTSLSTGAGIVIGGTNMGSIADHISVPTGLYCTTQILVWDSNAGDWY